MADWPSELVITRKNFREKPPKNTVRSAMDVGPDKIRKRSSSAIRPVSLRMFLTDAQVQILDDFYADNEALSFNFVHPRTGATVKARFVSEPDWQPEETMWNASVDLEILP